MSKKNKNTGWNKRMAFAMLSILSENDDGKMSRSRLLKAVEEREGKLIPDEMRGKTRTTGHLKWEIHLRFYCQKFVKAEFLRMDKGTWTLTREGANALSNGMEAVTAKADKSYAEFRKKRVEQIKKEQEDLLKEQEDLLKVQENDAVADMGGGKDSDEGESSLKKEYILSDLESDAIGEIEEYIQSMGEDGMVFQQLCAALLRGMGYHVRHVSPPGPDGGIDVVAYKDLLGYESPRIILQAKCQKNPVQTNVIVDFADVLTDNDVGIVVCSSKFAAGCSNAVRKNKTHHIELIDLNRLIDLWCQHYDNLSEEDKALLPLQKVYFLNKKESKKGKLL